MGGTLLLRLLLDTHAIIWWQTANARLSNRALTAINDESNARVFSAASIWEIVTKHRLGRLPAVDEFVHDIVERLKAQRYEELPVTATEAALAGSLPDPVRDPFDRMLIAQARLNGLVLVSNERVFDQYGVQRLW